jgi:hypothetical protein
MKLFKFLAFFVMFLFSLFPTTVASIYMFGGKEAFVKFIAQIPADRFWLLGIPLIILAYTASVGLLYYALDAPNKPKKVVSLSIDDPNLEKKLAKLYN